MYEQFPVVLISTFLSITLLCFLLYRYLSYKTKLDVIKELDRIKTQEGLTKEDFEFIKSNEQEYKEKVIKAQQNINISQPIFILIAGVLVLLFELQEALIHLNVVIVAYIFMQVDKLHKRNIYEFLKELEKDS